MNFNKPVFALVLAIFLMSVVKTGASSLGDAPVLPIPSVDEHADFLLEPWKPNAPTLVVFKDPFCPYCIKAFERKDELKPYNVFLFWYPIFGERSHRRVEEIFRCSSPVSAQVINAVVARESPVCDGTVKEHLMVLNRKMYEAYTPSGVPSYHMGGVKVTMSQVKKSHQFVSSVEASVNVDWQRYQENRLNIESSQLAKVSLILPRFYQNIPELIVLLKKHINYDWYFFLDAPKSSYLPFCEHLTGGCDSQTLEKYSLMSQELKLLYGLNALAAPEIVLNGKILSDAEKQAYFPFLKELLYPH